MPKSFCFADCTNNKAKNPKLKFYVLPAKKSRRDKWLAAIKRMKVVKETTDNGKKPRKNIEKKLKKIKIDQNKRWSPSPKKRLHTYVCSAHFLSGKSFFF